MTSPAHKKHVLISDLVRVHACPVRFYYEQHNSYTESERYAVSKQLSYHLGKALDADDIWNEIIAVHPAMDPTLRDFLDICISSCTKTDWKFAVQTDVRVASDTFAMAGMIDRVFDDGSFSIVRASGAMPFGTYAADRLRIAAIGFCLDEMTGTETSGGHVEYIPDGVSRFHEIQPRDRRQVIAALKKIQEIHEGEIPKHPLNAPCNRCMYKEKCESSVGQRLSELL
jgi:CRISPR-associated exonuclease Cas4